MARAKMPSKTILKGTLDFFNDGTAISLPIFVYKKTSVLKKADTHMHHAVDGGRIYYNRICDRCQENVPLYEVEKMVVTENGMVSVTKEEIDEIFNETQTSVSVICTLPAKKVNEYLSKEIMVPKEAYQIVAFRPDTKSPPLKAHETILKSLLTALTSNKQVLMVSAFLGQMQRNAVLFPNGTMLALCWEEELRETIPWQHEDGVSKEMVDGFKAIFKSVEAEMANIPSTDSFDKMAEFLESKTAIPDGTTSLEARKTQSGIEKFVEQMQEMVENTKSKKKTKKGTSAKAG